MAWQKIKVGRTTPIEHQEVLNLEVCDVCERRMPDGIHPRFSMEVETRKNLYGSEDTTPVYFHSLCSPSCVAAAAAEYSAAEWPPSPEGEEFTHRDEYGSADGAGRLVRKMVWVRRAAGDPVEG